MKKFLYLFPPGLALPLGLFGAFAETEKLWYALLFAAPWLLVSPLMARRWTPKLLWVWDLIFLTQCGVCVAAQIMFGRLTISIQDSVLQVRNTSLRISNGSGYSHSRDFVLVNR